MRPTCFCFGTFSFEATYSNFSGCVKRGRMYKGKIKFLSRSKPDKAVANQKTKRQEDTHLKKRYKKTTFSNMKPIKYTQISSVRLE